jgi:hypothetical protein
MYHMDNPRFHAGPQADAPEAAAGSAGGPPPRAFVPHDTKKQNMVMI